LKEQEEKPIKERVKSVYREKGEREPRYREKVQEEKERVKSKAKSVRRDELVVENKVTTGEHDTNRVVFGLSGEMALKASTSKKEKKRILEEMRKQ
jgi:hypothetical protein